MLSQFVNASFLISLSASFSGAALKIMHQAGAGWLFVLSLIATVVFIISALIEIRRSPKIDHREKTMWTIAFIFMSGVTGIVYMVMGRRRVNGSSAGTIQMS